MILIGTSQIPALKAALCAAFCARLRRAHLWSKPITRRGHFRRSAAALLPSTDGRIICSDSGCAWGFCSASTYLSDSGCTRGSAVSRSRIAPYRSLTRLSLDVIRVARRTSAEMPNFRQVIFNTNARVVSCALKGGLGKIPPRGGGNVTK